MTLVTLVYTGADRTTAEKIRHDLNAAQIDISETIKPGEKPIVILLLSTQATADIQIQNTLDEAVDKHLHIIPVLTQHITLPRLIDHLQPLDFSHDYAPQALIAQVERFSQSDAPKPITALTRARRARNKRLGIIMGVSVVAIFVIALILIPQGVQAPAGEFDGVETQIFMTRNAYIDDVLPVGTAEAAEFQATFEHARPSLQPYLAATATAIHEGVQGTYIPRTTEEAENFAATVMFIPRPIRDSFLQTATAAAGE